MPTDLGVKSAVVGFDGRASELVIRLPIWWLHPLGDLLLSILSIGVGLVILRGIAVAARAGFFDGEILVSFLAVLSPLVTMVAYVAPVPVVREALVTKNVDNLPVRVFWVQLSTNVMCIAYGMQISNSAILLSNFFGLSCQVCYLAVVHHVQPLRTKTRKVRFMITLFGVFFTNVGGSVVATSASLLGYAIVLANMLLYATPLVKVPHVLATRDPSCFPLGMTCMSSLNCAVWTLYALLIEDLVLLIPSVFGYASAGLQLLLIAWAQNDLPFDLSFLELLLDLLISRGAAKPRSPSSQHGHSGYGRGHCPGLTTIGREESFNEALGSEAEAAEESAALSSTAEGKPVGAAFKDFVGSSRGITRRAVGAREIGSSGRRVSE